jgi:hypothetical protein
LRDRALQVRNAALLLALLDEADERIPRACGKLGRERGAQLGIVGRAARRLLLDGAQDARELVPGPLLLALPERGHPRIERPHRFGRADLEVSPVDAPEHAVRVLREGDPCLQRLQRGHRRRVFALAEEHDELVRRRGVEERQQHHQVRIHRLVGGDDADRVVQRVFPRLEVGVEEVEELARPVLREALEVVQSLRDERDERPLRHRIRIVLDDQLLERLGQRARAAEIPRLGRLEEQRLAALRHERAQPRHVRLAADADGVRLVERGGRGESMQREQERQAACRGAIQHPRPFGWPPKNGTFRHSSS